MQFYRTNVEVGKEKPPEELLTSLTGTFGLWQILVVSISCVSLFFYGLYENTIRVSTPEFHNYTCRDGNGSRCFDSNGNDCQNFTFLDKSFHFITFTEKFSMVCKMSHYSFWVKEVYRIGMVVGTVVVGQCVDRLGIKKTAMAFIPLQSLLGFFTNAVVNVEILMTMYFFYAVVCTSTRLLPIIAVCDSVGNNWRTLSLGLLFVCENISLVLFTAIRDLFEDVGGIIAATSLLPLLLLIPLLYFMDSPNYISIAEDFAAYDRILRKIGEINKRPVSSNAKIRPVHTLTRAWQPDKTSYVFELLKEKQTRKSFLALSGIYFLVGYNITTILEHTYLFSNYQTYILSAFRVIGTTVCVAVLHLIPHKYLIGIISFARNLCLGGVLVYAYYFKITDSNVKFYLAILASMLNTMCHLTLLNLSPRMFPTELRTRSVGCCLSILYLGTVTSKLIRYLSEKALWVTLGILCVCPILETMSCFFMWNVHKRELPDFLLDCIRFEKFYKPTRFFLIYDDTASEHEIEVRRILLDQSEE